MSIVYDAQHQTSNIRHQTLPRAFYLRDPITVARALLGQRLVRIHEGQRLAGIIVETEAYLGAADRAAHSFNGHRSPRNQSMYLAGGHAYVYFTYGMHNCMNVVAGIPEVAVAALVRALEPTEGLDAMRRLRGFGDAHGRDTQLCSGPGKLCQALAIDRRLDGVDLVTSDELFIEAARRRALPGRCIVASKRVGVAYAGRWAHRALRFYVRGCAHVSKR